MDENYDVYGVYMLAKEALERGLCKEREGFWENANSMDLSTFVFCGITTDHPIEKPSLIFLIPLENFEAAVHMIATMAYVSNLSMQTATNSKDKALKAAYASGIKSAKQKIEELQEHPPILIEVNLGSSNLDPVLRFCGRVQTYLEQKSVIA